MMAPRFALPVAPVCTNLVQTAPVCNFPGVQKHRENKYFREILKLDVFLKLTQPEEIQAEN
jgi:hypothetical protein